MTKRMLAGKLFIRLFSAVLFLAAAAGLRAETRRALLVGINTYSPPQRSSGSAGSAVSPEGRATWTNLDGCTNDIEVMRELLEAKFHFKRENIMMLPNGEATREAMLAAIRKHLTEASSKGDVAFFYYAGHGSRVTNSLNGEAKQKDETLVPADSNTGVWDIRDKEIARYFNAILDKGILLTAVFDSCHSGSIARGFPSLQTGKSRWLPEDPRDVRIPPDPGRRPEERTELKERGILILSAAQDYQTAAEAWDEEAEAAEGKPRGAFSLALSRVLRAVPENESASRIFNRVSTAMASDNYSQIPVLGGTAERLDAPLFGVGTSRSSTGVSVAVLEVRDGEVDIRGGYAIGLAPGCELGLPAADGRPKVRIRVTDVKGLAQSTAEIIEGSASSIQPRSSLFQVEKWTSSSAESALKLWWPSPPPKIRDIDALLGEIRMIKNSGKITWIGDPVLDSPDWTVRFDGRSWCLLEAATGRRETLKGSLRADDILAAIPSDKARPSKVFIGIPPPEELVSQLRIGGGKANDAISLVASESEANYSLVGRMEGDGIQVAWIRLGAAEELVTTPMPARSDWCSINAAPESLSGALYALEDAVQRLQQIKGWLHLKPMGGDDPFPYHLKFMNTKGGTLTSGPLYLGEFYNLVLVRDKATIGKPAEPRRAYIFAIDSFGNGSLLFPSHGEGDNLLPPRSHLESGEDIILRDGASPIKIIEPVGFDAYFLLTSKDPLGHPSEILDFEGVRTRAAPQNIDASNPLERLLMQVGSSSRGGPVSAPESWSITSIIVKSVSKR